MKNIVICCDGTGNEYGRNNTNVVETYVLAEKDTGQVAYYDPGVGTGGWGVSRGARRAARPGRFRPPDTACKRTSKTPYRYLMGPLRRRRPRVPLRVQPRRLHGALAGRDAPQVRTARRRPRQPPRIHVEDLQHRAQTKRWPRASARRSGAGARSASSGVWDSVESLVLNAGKRFSRYRAQPRGRVRLPRPGDRREAPGLSSLPMGTRRTPRRTQTIEQVWFAGSHSDVGGWYEERGAREPRAPLDARQGRGVRAAHRRARTRRLPARPARTPAPFLHRLLEDPRQPARGRSPKVRVSTGACSSVSTSRATGTNPATCPRGMWWWNSAGPAVQSRLGAGPGALLRAGGGRRHPPAPARRGGDEGNLVVVSWCTSMSVFRVLAFPESWEWTSGGLRTPAAYRVFRAPRVRPAVLATARQRAPTWPDSSGGHPPAGLRGLDAACRMPAVSRVSCRISQ